MFTVLLCSYIGAANRDLVGVSFSKCRKLLQLVCTQNEDRLNKHFLILKYAKYAEYDEYDADESLSACQL